MQLSLFKVRNVVMLCTWLCLLRCGDPEDDAARALLTLTPPPGTFVAEVAVEVRSRDRTATLHYTLDGSLPTPQAPILSSTLRLTQTTEVRVLVVKPDGQTTVRSALYLRVDEEVASFSSNLPVVIVHMMGSEAPSPDDHTYQRAGLLIAEPRMAGRATPVNPDAETARAGIKVRGRSTRYDAKHSYSLETWGDIDQKDLGMSLLGMPSESDWALYAPFTWDRSYMRNALMYALSHDLGRYAARTRFVELFLTQGDQPVSMTDYLGIYVFMERLTRDPQRVAIQSLRGQELTAPDITGGYIVKVDDPGDGERGFSAAGLRFAHVYPDEEDTSDDQQRYIARYLEDVAAAAKHAPTSHDGRPLPPYQALIDVGSFIDHHILNTFAKNPDALRLSAFFHKDRGEPLHAGPIWDFDRSLGSNDERSTDPTGWSASQDGTRLFEHPLWVDLFADENFRTAYRTRFREVLQGALAPARVHAHIHRFATELDEASRRDADRWPEARPANGRYDNEVQALLQWTEARSRWIDANLQSVGDE